MCFKKKTAPKNRTNCRNNVLPRKHIYVYYFEKKENNYEITIALLRIILMNHMHFYFCPLYTHIYYNNDRRFYMNKKQNSLIFLIF